MKESKEITTEQLNAIVQSLDPRAPVVPARILRRITKGLSLLGPLGLHLTHRRSQVVATDSALDWVSAEELGLSATEPRPDILLLIEEPLNQLEEGEGLVWLWRCLFHLRVHVAVEEKHRNGLLNECIVAERIQAIGAAEFAEARSVLEQDSWLVSPDNVPSVYVEFAAVFLELRQFFEPVCHAYFPRIEDFGRVEGVLAQDVDFIRVFESTRPQGAPDPTPHPPEEDPFRSVTLVQDDEVSSRSESVHRWLLRRADRARSLGNLVRSAILRTRAARLVGRSLAGQARSGAVEDIDKLTSRLIQATEVKGHNSSSLRPAFAALLALTNRAVWSIEARLLYDLQKVCLDQEREVFELDLWRWLFSLGKRPLKRPLPNQKFVRTSKHLRQAQARLARVRIDDASHATLTAFLQEATTSAEQQVRERFRPLIERSLERADLKPQNPPERVSFERAAEELLDVVVNRGHLLIGEVRDAIARCDIRQPDLSGAAEMVGGDRVLKANRRLNVSLAGVYRPGEIYLRMLQRVSLLTFGTRPGRWFVWYIALPFGGAFGAIKTIEELLHVILRVHEDITAAMTNRWSILALGIFILLVIHWKAYREAFKSVLSKSLRLFRLLLIDGPTWILNRPMVRAVLSSQWFDLVRRLILVPALCGALTLFIAWRLDRDWNVAAWLGLGAFTIASLFLGTPVGREMEEVAAESALRGWSRLRVDLLPGIARFIMEVFDLILQTVERILYAVDEMLRFKSGESKATLYLKAVLGVFWGMTTYLIRIYINLLVEPTINPIKHFPTVTVAAKMILPMLDKLYFALFAVFAFMGKWTAGSIAALTVIFLPGLAGFIVWELKENWKLFEANRPKNLEPMMIGHHGESMRRLLLPGFHSGTIPKLFAKLRKAEKQAFRYGKLAKARKTHEALHHVEESIRHFVERGFLATLIDSGRFSHSDMALTEIRLSTNRVLLDFSERDKPNPFLRIAFDNAEGKLIQRVEDQGGRRELDCERREIMDAALIVMAARAGADELVDHDGPSRDLLEKLCDEATEIPLKPEVCWTRWVAFWETEKGEPFPAVLAFKSPAAPSSS